MQEVAIEVPAESEDGSADLQVQFLSEIEQARDWHSMVHPQFIAQRPPSAAI